MKALQTLQRQTADNLVALTYNLDLPFFESAVFGPLHAGGCRNVAILCDPAQYQVSLRDVSVLRHLGRGYVCLPAEVSAGAFHPKLTLLTSRDEGFMCVGSANISGAGLTSNLEVVTTFSYSEKAPDERIRRAFRWAFEYLSRLCGEVDNSLLKARLDMLWQTTGWLHRDPGSFEESFADQGCWLMHNLNRPLLDQMTDLWSSVDGSGVEEAIVVSPYFDRAGLALRELLGRFRPRELTLVTERGAQGMEPWTFRRALEESGVDWRMVSPESSTRPPVRRLHAKVLALRTRKGAWVLTGSPNLSSPGLLRAAPVGNAELAVLRHEEGLRLLDTFVGPLLAAAEPIRLDWEAPPDKEDTETPRDGYRVLSAELYGVILSLRVDPQIPPNARLRVELVGSDDIEFEPETWTAEEHEIRIKVPEGAECLLSGPASVGITVQVEGDNVRSDRMAVHIPETIRTNSWPVRGQTQMRVPSTLISLQAAQHLDLLDLLRNLLVTNSEKLRERRGISAASVRERDLEQNLDNESPYDPEAMIVEETVRTEIGSGAALYGDYKERSLYEHVMAALRAVVHQPQRDAGTSLPDGQDPSLGTNVAEPSGPEAGRKSPHIVGRRVRHEASAVKKVVAQFSHLVTDFEGGMRDTEYLAQVYAPDLKKLLFVLTTYLRLLRLEGLVDRGSFIRLSERLFDSLVPEAGDAGWSGVPVPDDGSLERDEAETHGWKQAWMHLYLVADLCFEDEPERLPNLAGLLRRFSRNVGSPALLRGLPEELLGTIWRGTFYPDRKPPKGAKIIVDLDYYSQWYSTRTLIRELRRSPLTQVHLDFKFIQGRDVPTLTLVEPWHDDRLDHYWETFVKFYSWSDNWPEPRKSARLTVRDANRLQVDPVQDHRLVLFYRSDEHKLRIKIDAVESGVYRGMVQRVTPSEVPRLRTFAAVINHETEKTLAGSKPPMNRS